MTFELRLDPKSENQGASDGLNQGILATREKAEQVFNQAETPCRFQD